MTPQQDKILSEYYNIVAPGDSPVRDGILTVIDLVREHDEKLGGTPTPLQSMQRALTELDQLRDQVARLTKERDEARRQLADAIPPGTVKLMSDEESREQGRQEAREGIAKCLERDAVKEAAYVKNETAMMITRALADARGKALVQAVQIARNWKPEVKP